MDMGVEIEHFACGGDEPDDPCYDIVAVKVDLKIQPEGSPSTPGQLAQQFSIVAEEDSQALGEGENDLPVRDIFEQLLSGPMGPQELTLFVATRTQTSSFAGEANDKFETASFATRSRENSKIPQSSNRYTVSRTIALK